jgi:hypothetical protein
MSDIKLKPGWLQRQAEQVVNCHPAHVRKLQAALKSLLQVTAHKDYAIEHAEYLAKAAEFYLDTRNLADAAADDEEPFDPQRLYDANNGLRSAIYEFRKRAATPQVPPQAAQFPHTPTPKY